MFILIIIKEIKHNHSTRFIALHLCKNFLFCLQALINCFG